MRKLRIFEHISLDGVIQMSADENDFPYGDWTGPYRSPAGRDLVTAMYGEKFDLLLGRRTYDGFSEFWPKAPSSPLADRLNAAKKYVATRRPDGLAWGPFESVGPDFVGWETGVSSRASTRVTANAPQSKAALSTVCASSAPRSKDSSRNAAIDDTSEMRACAPGAAQRRPSRRSR